MTPPGNNLSGNRVEAPIGGKMQINAQSIIDSIDAGVIVLDADLKIRSYNRAAEAFFRKRRGRDISEALGLGIDGILPDGGIISMLEASRNSGDVKKKYGHKVQVPDGETGEAYWDITVSPIKNDQISGVVLHFIEVTDLQSYVKSAERQKKEAEFYVDLLSHDIRNYNQITMGYIELLTLSGNLTETDLAYLEKAQKGVSDINRLLDNIKLVRRIRETGRKDLDRIDIGEILLKDIDRIKKATPGTSVIVNYDAESLRGHYIMANEFIHFVFSHILENAVKYDPSPEKVIDVAMSDVKKDGKEYWSVRIADHGVGVPDERKTSIFERMSRTTRGVGVGLSIVSIIIDVLKGTILVEDRVQGDPSLGAVFIVQLPKA